MEMTPAKVAFIKGQKMKETKATAVETPTSNLPLEKMVEPEKLSAASEEPKEARSRPSRRASRRSGSEAPEAREVLDQVLVPVTVRVVVLVLRHRSIGVHMLMLMFVLVA